VFVVIGVVQELSAHVIPSKNSQVGGDVGQIHVSWLAADAGSTDEDGRMELLQYNVSWINSDDGSHGEICLEPYIHKCSFPAQHHKYVTFIYSYIRLLVQQLTKHNFAIELK